VAIPRQSLVNALRSLGYTFKRQADRVEIYKQKGTTARQEIPRRDWLDDEYALRSIADDNPDSFFAIVIQKDGEVTYHTSDPDMPIVHMMEELKHKMFSGQFHE